MVKSYLNAFEAFKETKKWNFVILKDKSKTHLNIYFIRIQMNVKTEPFNISI